MINNDFIQLEPEQLNDWMSIVLHMGQLLREFVLAKKKTKHCLYQDSRLLRTIGYSEPGACSES